MPIRFHVAVRDEACDLCHKEHDDSVKSTTSSAAFSHRIIPSARLDECRRCHVGIALKDHSRTDQVACQNCHGLTGWTGQTIDHAKVSQIHCDVCHAAPATEAHAQLAGTCSTCHEVMNWDPKPSAPPVSAPGSAPRADGGSG